MWSYGFLCGYFTVVINSQEAGGHMPLQSWEGGGGGG